MHAFFYIKKNNYPNKINLLNNLYNKTVLSPGGFAIYFCLKKTYLLVLIKKLFEKSGYAFIAKSLLNSKTFAAENFSKSLFSFLNILSSAQHASSFLAFAAVELMQQQLALNIGCNMAEIVLLQQESPMRTMPTLELSKLTNNTIAIIFFNNIKVHAILN